MVCVMSAGLIFPWRKFTGGIYPRADEARVSNRPDFCTAASVAPWHQKAKTAAVCVGVRGGLGVQRGFNGEKKEKRGKEGIYLARATTAEW